MIRVVIVDDEIHGRETLKQMLERFCVDVSVVGLASDADQGIQLIQSCQPDLVFLDVEMEYSTGFDLLNHFPTPTFQVVFVTGYSEYALNAIKVSALDYLLKPVSIDDLQKVVKKTEQILQQKTSLDLKHLLSAFQETKQTPSSTLKVPNTQGFEIIQIDALMRCEAEKDYTVLHLEGGGQMLSSNGIGEYEDILAKHDFFRIHNSHIVRFKYIRKYIRGEGGIIVLSDKTELPVSRRRKAEFLEWMNAHTG